MQRQEGEFLRHFSRADKVILACSAVFVLLIAGYFWGQNSWKASYTVAVAEPGVSSQTDTTDTGGAAEEDSSENTAADQEASQTDTAVSQETSQTDTADTEVKLININTATAEELTALPSIGDVRAAAIVAYREEHGAFQMVEELTDVPGIGDGILSQVIDQITVGNEGESEDGQNTGGG